MYKQVENYFVNEVISDLVTTMCQTCHYNTKIYELPQLSVKSVVLQDLDTKQVVNKDLANGVVHKILKNLLVTMQFDKYLRFTFKCDRPDLLFFELDSDLIANKIVARYTKLQNQGKRAKQLAVAK